MSDDFDSGCGGPSVIWHDGTDGVYYIEVVGQGILKSTLPIDGAPGFFATLPGYDKGSEGLEQWKDLIWKHAIRTQLPAAWIAAFIAAESRGQYNAINFGDNPHGVGLTQITSAGLRRGLTDEELLDPDLNIEIGSDFLLKIAINNGGNPLRAAASYNAGGAYCGAYGQCLPNRWNLKTNCPPGSTGTTPDYVGSIIGLYNAAVDAGFSPADVPRPPEEKLPEGHLPGEYPPALAAGASSDGSGVVIITGLVAAAAAWYFLRS